jgi:hypothetical protein
VEVVRTKIAFQSKLIRTKGISFQYDFLSLLLNLVQVATGYLSGNRSRQLVYQDDFRAQCIHHSCTFCRVAPGHDGYEGIPLHSAHNCQTGSGVSTGEFHNGLPGFEVATFFGVLDDLFGDSVFFGKSRIKILQFCKDGAIRSGGESAELNQRRLADGLDHRRAGGGCFHVRLPIWVR